MIRFYLAIFVTLSLIGQLYAQGEIDDQETIFYRNESTIGVLFNSNGFGINYRYASRQNAFKSTLYDVDFVRIKAVNEQKIGSLSFNNDVFGQINSLVALRLGIGLQTEKISKRDKGSISIRYFYSGGLTNALIKPVYYLTADSSKKVRYDYDVHASFLYLPTKASYFYGLNEASYLPGVFAKFGFCFEYSPNNNIINALEGAIGIDVFPKPIQIMYNESNFYYISFILTYRFGKVINAQAKRNKNKIDKAVQIGN